MLTLPQIQASLDLKLPGEFIAKTLGVEPAERDKRALFWSDDQFDEIKTALVNYIKGCEIGDAPAKPVAVKKAAAKPAAKAPVAHDPDLDDGLDDDGGL